MSFFEDEEDLHDEGLCDPETCRFCQAEDDCEDGIFPDLNEDEDEV